MSSSLHQRRRLRHEGYDYHTPGAYFVTICVENALPLLGQKNQDTIALNPAGNMVTEVWYALTDTFPTVKLDEIAVMPNHIHFIIWLTASALQQITVMPDESHNESSPKTMNPSLPDVMQWFKSLTTARYRQGVYTFDWPLFPGRLWQRSYYEHIVRSDAALYAIRRYIQNNPKCWHYDRYHPNPVGQDLAAIELWRFLQNEERPT